MNKKKRSSMKIQGFCPTAAIFLITASLVLSASLSTQLPSLFTPSLLMKIMVMMMMK